MFDNYRVGATLIRGQVSDVIVGLRKPKEVFHGPHELRSVYYVSALGTGAGIASACLATQEPPAAIILALTSLAAFRRATNLTRQRAQQARQRRMGPWGPRPFD